MNNADAMLITLLGMSQDLKCTIDLKFDEMGLHCIISKDDHHREFVIGKYTLSNLFDPASCLIAQINNDAAELNVEIIKDKHKPTLMDESVWAYAKKHQRLRVSEGQLNLDNLKARVCDADNITLVDIKEDNIL